MSISEEALAASERQFVSPAQRQVMAQVESGIAAIQRQIVGILDALRARPAGVVDAMRPRPRGEKRKPLGEPTFECGLQRVIDRIPPRPNRCAIGQIRIRTARSDGAGPWRRLVDVVGDCLLYTSDAADE